MVKVCVFFYLDRQWMNCLHYVDQIKQTLTGDKPKSMQQIRTKICQSNFIDGQKQG